MAKKKKPKDEFEIYAEEYGEDELETLLELLEEFPEIEEYFDDDMFDSILDDKYWSE